MQITLIFNTNSELLSQVLSCWGFGGRRAQEATLKSTTCFGGPINLLHLLFLKSCGCWLLLPSFLLSPSVLPFILPLCCWTFLWLWDAALHVLQPLLCLLCWVLLLYPLICELSLLLLLCHLVLLRHHLLRQHLLLSHLHLHLRSGCILSHLHRVVSTSQHREGVSDRSAPKAKGKEWNLRCR